MSGAQNYEQIKSLISCGYYLEAQSALDANQNGPSAKSTIESVFLIYILCGLGASDQASALATDLDALNDVPLEDLIDVYLFLRTAGEYDTATAWRTRSMAQMSPSEKRTLCDFYLAAEGDCSQLVRIANETWLSEASCHLISTIAIGLARCQQLSLAESVVDLALARRFQYGLATAKLHLFLLEGKLGEATAWFNKIQATDGVPPIVSEQLSQIYFRARDWQNTAIHALNVILSQPWNERQRYNYAVSVMELGDKESAEFELSELLESDIVGRNASHLLGKLYLRGGQLFKYYSLIRRVLRADWIAPTGDRNR